MSEYLWSGGLNIGRPFHRGFTLPMATALRSGLTEEYGEYGEYGKNVRVVLPNMLSKQIVANGAC